MKHYFCNDIVSLIFDVFPQLGQAKKKKEKKFKLDEFLPIYSQVKKDKDCGSYEDFIEVLKLYDKDLNGSMMFAELEHILLSLGQILYNLYMHY